MSRVLAVFGCAALLATGVGAGMVVASGEPSAGEPAPAAIVVVRGPDGAPREMTAAEAAARLERLEAQAARAVRVRAAVQEEEAGEAAEAPRVPDRELPWVPIPTKPDGTRYSVSELRDLARNSSDPVLRMAAIRALRRDDTPEARVILEEIVTDAKTPAELRIEAAKALAKPPHRDQTPEELVKLLAATDLPAGVRVEIAEGVARLRDRGAWMAEISGQLAKEADADVRAFLFDAVQRSASDPAAKAELASILGNPAAKPDEARAAAQALARLGNDRHALAALQPLLTSADAVLRGEATAAWAKAGRLDLAQLTGSMGDDAASVRMAVFAASVPQLPKDATKEQKDERLDALRKAADVALTDADADVRRAALAWTGAMPKELKEKVLEAARSDANPLVAIDAYSRSPAPVVREQPERILTQLDSADPKVRDAAYRLVVKTWGVDVPYRAGWNPAARARAVAEIRTQVGTR